VPSFKASGAARRSARTLDDASMKRIALICGIAVAALALGGLVGIIAGYFIGYGDAAGRDAPSRAAYSVATLKALRSGDTTGALSMLETQLDGQLMERWMYDQSSHILASSASQATQAKVLRFAADYRTQYPTQSDDVEVKAAIAEVVAKYK
jgi:hypothetical protein